MSLDVYIACSKERDVLCIKEINKAAVEGLRVEGFKEKEREVQRSWPVSPAAGRKNRALCIFHLSMEDRSPFKTPFIRYSQKSVEKLEA